MQPKSIITGVKPTGVMPHIGNLLGAILPFAELAKTNQASIFIADLHALTTIHDAERLRENTRQLALTYFSIFGIDTQVTIFRQSDIVNIPKLNWILCNVTPYSLMLRAHSFKDAEQKNSDINMGVFNYPILMAADILGYDIDLVPVGEDQRQHLEMTRDIARNFNQQFGQEIFKLPKEYIEKSVATLPGIDGRKMSKSYDNFIGVFEDDATLKKKVMAIVTDSTPVDAPKDPETCNVFALIRVFGTPEEQADIASKYRLGGFGYGHAKLALLDILKRFLAPYHARRSELEKDFGLIETKLSEGARVMNDRLDRVMERVRGVVGL
jgi:tryptophanyl-tRNA synthetase